MRPRKQKRSCNRWKVIPRAARPDEHRGGRRVRYHTPGRPGSTRRRGVCGEGGLSAAPPSQWRGSKGGGATAFIFFSFPFLPRLEHFLYLITKVPGSSVDPGCQARPRSSSYRGPVPGSAGYPEKRDAVPNPDCLKARNPLIDAIEPTPL